MRKMGRALVAAGAFWVCFGSVDVQAMYILPALEDVPIERLVENIQQKIALEPSNVQWRYTLARLYSMAYAKRALTAPSPTESWYGDEPGMPYYHPYLGWDVGGKDPMQKGAATEAQVKEFLARAIETYQEALRLDPGHLHSMIGLAWCYEENGQVDEAIAEYRKVHELAWKKERPERERVAHDIESITFQSGQALLRLLPTDRATMRERRKIQRHIQTTQTWPMSITPLIIPLTDSNDFRELVQVGGRPTRGIWFDLVGGGKPAWWEWITEKAGWLVWDPRGSGLVADGRQLFGSTTWWIFWSNGYQPLSLLDDDQDGWLTGAELNGLAIWHDRDLDGQTQQGELQPIASWGITALACQHAGMQGETLYHPSGAHFANGAQRATYDWISHKLEAPSLPDMQAPDVSMGPVRTVPMTQPTKP